MCTCKRLLFCLSNITYIFERLASCCALTSVVTCIMTTVLIMLAIGVGLGYNYCYVDNETGRHKEEKDSYDFHAVETHVTTSFKGLIIRPGRKSAKGVVGKMATPTATAVPPEINATMIAPLNIGINFPRLISEIRKKKINVTLELTV